MSGGEMATTATVRDHRGQRATGEIKAWLGGGFIEVEDDLGRRWVGRDVDKAPKGAKT